MLLAAVAGPARPDEIAGESAAVAAFTRSPGPVRNRGHRRRAPDGALGTAVAVSVAALLLGGTAYAAGTGQLPDALQEFLPGAAAPVPDRSARAAPTDRGFRAGDPTPRPSTSPAPQPSATEPADAAELERLCRSWTAFRADPHAGPVTAEERRTLAHAAGGENGIDGLCQAAARPGATAFHDDQQARQPRPRRRKAQSPGKAVIALTADQAVAVRRPSSCSRNPTRSASSAAVRRKAATPSDWPAGSTVDQCTASGSPGSSGQTSRTLSHSVMTWSNRSGRIVQRLAPCGR